MDKLDYDRPEDSRETTSRAGTFILLAVVVAAILAAIATGQVDWR